jgi:phosphonate transport system substrate-binding protein
MKKNIALLALLLAFALVAAACSDDEGEGDGEAAGEWPEEIIYGFIPSEQQETLADTVVPYTDYLSEELGITVTPVITADYNGLVVAMGAGQTDLGAFGPLGYVQAQTQYPTIELLMQSVRRGSKTYHGQWFTNDPSICDEGTLQQATALVGPEEAASLGTSGAGSITQVPIADAIAQQVGLDYTGDAPAPEVLDDGSAVAPGTTCTASLESVAGKKIAFGSATSTSATVYPQLQLINVGIDIENDVEYDYLGSHDATVAAVYAGDFDIGLSYDDARRTMRNDNTDVGSKVIVFNLTDEIPNDVVAVRGDLPDDLKQAIFDATAAFLATDEGKAVFEEIYDWTSIQKGVESDFDVVREAQEKLGISE